MWIPRIYLLPFLLLLLQGIPRSLGIFFSQRDYLANITTEHPPTKPVLRIFAFDQLSKTTHITCNIVNATSSSRHSSNKMPNPDNLFRITTNGTEVCLFYIGQGTEGPVEDHVPYNIHIKCETPKPSYFSKLPNVDISLSEVTSVVVTVFNAEFGRQVSPCTGGEVQLREVCFAGFTDHLAIRENIADFVATEWRGSTLPGCESVKTSYSVTIQHGSAKVPASLDDQGLLHIHEALDYEKRGAANLTVDCKVDGFENITHHRVDINIVNINDNIPWTTNNYTSIGADEIRIDSYENGKELITFIVRERDGPELFEDFIVTSVENDNNHQFMAKGTYISLSSVAVGLNMVVSWAKPYSMTDNTYTFDVKIRDYGYIGDDYEGDFYEFTYTIELELPALGNVSWNAAPYSRVTPREDLPDGEDYEIVIDDINIPFAITPHEGILYVNNSEALKLYMNSVIPLKIIYNNITSMTYTTEIGVSMLPGEHENKNGIRNCDKSCMANNNESQCVDSCGLGTTSGSCVWRKGCSVASRKDQYCTCTYGAETCPDGRCDELETMIPELCPIDCTDSGQLLNKRTGFQSHCWCPEQGECECHTRPDPSDAITKALRPTIGPNQCGTVCLIVAVVGTIAVAIALAVTIALVHKNCRYQVTKETKEKPLGGSVASLSAAAPSDYIDSAEQRISSGVSQMSLERPQWSVTPQLQIDQKWEIHRKNIKLDKTLGEGEFGRVVRAELSHGIEKNGETKTVAVKMLKELATGSELRDLLSEYSLLKDVGHKNVIKLLGVCSKGGPFYLVVEYCEFGALRSFLRECRFNEYFYTDQQGPDSTGDTQENAEQEKYVSANDLLSFAWQIVKGMQYLSSMKLVHRDLAARNVLVAAGKVIKISDFGLSRDIYEEDTYLKRSKGRIPVKWMAPESLYEQIYTIKSDVWSFGITLWEIVTLGATPYPGLAPERLYHRLKSGYRMEKPTHCSDQLFRVMSWCWRTLPGDRPTFSQLAETLEAMLKQNVEYLDLGGAIDRNPILEDDNMVMEEQQDDQEAGYGSISRLTEDNAYLNPSNHGPHDFDDVICDDCTMRMIKEGDVTTECTKLLNCENEAVNNNCNSSNNPNNKPTPDTAGAGSRPLLYIQLHHENSDEEHEHVAVPLEVEVL